MTNCPNCPVPTSTKWSKKLSSIWYSAGCFVKELQSYNWKLMSRFFSLCSISSRNEDISLRILSFSHLHVYQEIFQYYIPLYCLCVFPIFLLLLRHWNQLFCFLLITALFGERTQNGLKTLAKHQKSYISLKK